MYRDYRWGSSHAITSMHFFFILYAKLKILHRASDCNIGFLPYFWLNEIFKGDSWSANLKQIWDRIALISKQLVSKQAKIAL
jgi:hypothetical protein